MQQSQRLRAVVTADMHVLTEHRELLGQVAIQAGDVLEARSIVDLAVVPALERMRASACDLNVEPVGTDHQCIAHCQQFGAQRGKRRMHCRADLEHALGDLGLDVAGKRLARHERDQVRRRARQIASSPVDQLELELHTHRQRLRLLEVEKTLAHRSSFASPLDFSANSSVSAPTT